MRYTKKPVTIEAIRFIGLTDFGDPQFDIADGMPEWLMDALAAPEGDPGSVFVTGITNGTATHKWLAVAALEADHIARDGDWIIRGIKGELYPCKPNIFEALYDVAADVAPEFIQAAKDGERSLLLDMQSECIQLRVALAKARDQFALYDKEHVTKAEGFEHRARSAAERGDKMVSENRHEDAQASRLKAETNRRFAIMCQTAIDCRPATQHPDCPRLEAIHAEGVDALAATSEGKAFVIGEGFRDTLGDSDGNDGA